MKELELNETEMVSVDVDFNTEALLELIGEMVDWFTI